MSSHMKYWMVALACPLMYWLALLVLDKPYLKLQNLAVRVLFGNLGLPLYPFYSEHNNNPLPPH